MRVSQKLHKIYMFGSTDSAGTLRFSNNKNILHLMEGQSFTINCSNTLHGYPVPEVSIHLDSHKSSVSRREVSDNYDGTIVTASLNAVALKQWHNKPIYCSLHQQHFPSQNKSIILHVDRKC